MCFPVVSVHHEDDYPPNPVIVRQRPSASSSRIIVRTPASHHSHSHSSIIVRPTDTRPVIPSQYVSSSTSVPRIVHAPSPPRSPRASGTVIVISDSSPRGSHRSLHSARGSVRSSHHSHRSSGSRVNEVVYVESEVVRERSRDRSSRYLAPGSVSTRDRDRSTSRERDRLSDGGRQTLLIEEPPRRGRGSVIYESAPRVSRDRVLVEEDGRRYYRTSV